MFYYTMIFLNVNLFFMFTPLKLIKNSRFCKKRINILKLQNAVIFLHKEHKNGIYVSRDMYILVNKAYKISLFSI